jgi:hypothetical protein
VTAVLFDPASAIAAGICLTARSVAPRTVDRHPRPCGWCDYSPDELRQMIDGFNAWAGFSERSGTYERHDARVFAELPRAEQARLVLEAQAFPPERAMERSPEPPADATEADMTPSWMRPS